MIQPKGGGEDSHDRNLALENALVQIHPHILGHILHLLLDIILHAAAQMQELPHLGKVEEEIAAEEHDAEEEMPAEVRKFLGPGQIGRLNERAGRPHARDLDTVDRRAEELVVPLDDAQVAADEDEFLRPLVLVSEDLADGLAGGLLHLVVALGALDLAEPLQMLARGEVAAAVGPHHREGGEHV